MQHDDLGDVEWTEAELAQLTALPSERASGELLRARTIQALRDRELLVSRNRSARQWVAGIAAAALVFAAGGLAGYRLALSRLAASGATARVAAQVQQTDVPNAGEPTEERHVVWF